MYRSDEYIRAVAIIADCLNGINLRRRGRYAVTEETAALDGSCNGSGDHVFP